MKAFPSLLGCLTIAVTIGACAGPQASEPRFEDYAAEIWSGTVAPLDLESHPMAAEYRTKLGERIQEEGINFAGHYTLATAGCGTGCSIGAIIDAQTGKAVFPNQLFGWTSIVGDYEVPKGEDIWMYERDSRLLRLVGREHIGEMGEELYGPSAIYFYEWVDNGLRLVERIPVGSYPEADR